MTAVETSATATIFARQAGSLHHIDIWSNRSSDQDDPELWGNRVIDLSGSHVVYYCDTEAMPADKLHWIRTTEAGPLDRSSTFELHEWSPGIDIVDRSRTADWDSGHIGQLSLHDRLTQLSNIQVAPVHIRKGSSLGTEFLEIFDVETTAIELVEADDNRLSGALNDLRGAVEESSEEGFQTPSQAALSNAKRLLKEMYKVVPRRFEVYPTPDGEIAIDAPDGHGSSVLLLCDSRGGALCLVNLNGHHQHKSYAVNEVWLDRFLHEALRSLHPESN